MPLNKRGQESGGPSPGHWSVCIGPMHTLRLLLDKGGSSHKSGWREIGHGNCLMTGVIADPPLVCGVKRMRMDVPALARDATTPEPVVARLSWQLGNEDNFNIQTDNQSLFYYCRLFSTLNR